MFHDFRQIAELSLREVATVPLSSRAKILARVVEVWWPAPGLNVDSIAVQGMKSRVAWAVGFNLTLGFCAEDGSLACSQVPALVRRYLDKFGDEKVAVVLQSIRFDDLLSSVAAEQRDEWQPDEARPLDRHAAEEGFASLYEHCYDNVSARVARHLRRNEAEVAEWVDDAWSRAFECFWSEAATSRFRAAATLTLTISLIALRRAGKLPRESQWPLDGTGAEFELPVDDDPSREISASDDVRKLDYRLAGLTARQRLVAELVFRQEMSQADVAKRLGTSEANVSQLLKKVREQLQSLKSQFSS